MYLKNHLDIFLIFDYLLLFLFHYLLLLDYVHLFDYFLLFDYLLLFDYFLLFDYLHLFDYLLLGAGLKMRKLELQGNILAYYPMPNLESKSELQNTWLKTCRFQN